MKEVFLPVLHWFAMNNIFTGSCGNFRFRAEPNVIMATPKEVDYGASSIQVEFWHGIFCYEYSNMEGQQTFAMTEEGLENMKKWLESNI